MPQPPNGGERLLGIQPTVQARRKALDGADVHDPDQATGPAMITLKKTTEKHGTISGQIAVV